MDLRCGLWQPAIPVIAYLLQNQTLPTFLDFLTMFWWPPWQRLLTGAFVAVVATFFLVNLLAGWAAWAFFLWHGSRTGAILVLGLLPIEAAFWVAFSLPVPWMHRRPPPRAHSHCLEVAYVVIGSSRPPIPRSGRHGDFGSISQRSLRTLLILNPAKSDVIGSVSGLASKAQAKAECCARRKELSEDNKALVIRLFSDVFNGQNLYAADDIIAEEYLEHAVEPFGRQEPGRVEGPAHIRQVVAWLRAQFPDLEMTIESIVAEADVVAVRVHRPARILASSVALRRRPTSASWPIRATGIELLVVSYASTGPYAMTSPRCFKWT